MDFINDDIEAYALAHSTDESLVLKNLNRETHAKVLMPRMLSGHLQGSFLSMLSHMIKPKQILEIGTYTGYSAICLAQGLTDNGLLHTIDVNEELETMAKSHFVKAGVGNKIKQYIGNALDIIPTINEKFDLVFIDADKVNYSKYYDLVFDKISNGGYIIADNVLWSGQVLDLNKNSDERVIAIDAFNKKINTDDRVENLLLPIRDGLMLIRKNDH